jgi:hypothetical protein
MATTIPVFISHVSEDNEFTRRLAADLARRGFHAKTRKDVLPPQAILRDDQLHETLVDALENDTFVLAVLSPDFVKSRWTELEVETAIRAEERKWEVGLLPVLVRECDRPAILGLRTPSDFTSSYECGFEDLLARMSAPKSAIPAEQEQNLPFAASKAAANELQHSLSEVGNRLSELPLKQFEDFIVEQFGKHFSLQVKLPSGSRDGGIDVIALGGKDWLDNPVFIQCKRYPPAKRIGVEAVRSLFGTTGRNGPGASLIVTTSHFTRGAEAPHLREMCRDRWSLNLVDNDALVNWLAQTPSLGPDITAPLSQLRKRYATLVDKKYVGGLSVEEEIERARLAKALDEADANFYEPLKNALIEERDRLLRSKTSPPQAS